MSIGRAIQGELDKRSHVVFARDCGPDDRSQSQSEGRFQETKGLADAALACPG